MQRLGKDLEANAIELELRGLELELQVMRSSHAKLVQDISDAETQRSELQIRLNDLRGICA